MAAMEKWKKTSMYIEEKKYKRITIKLIERGERGFAQWVRKLVDAELDDRLKITKGDR